jgi:hypothetical protein
MDLREEVKVAEGVLDAKGPFEERSVCRALTGELFNEATEFSLDCANATESSSFGELSIGVRA